MKTSGLFLLTILFGAQSGPNLRELLEKLGTSRVEEREQATVKLLELGPGWLPELEKAARENPDEEVRGRIRAILEELQRRKRIAVLRPPPARLTIDVQDVPAAEAAEKLFRPFGLESLPKPPPSEPRKLSIRLNQATFWETYDAFFAGWKAKPNLRWTLVEFVEEGYLEPGFAKADFGDLRIAACPQLGVGVGEEQFCNLHVETLLPPGQFASFCEFETVEVFDDGGSKIDPRESGMKDGYDRTAGRIVTAGLWWAWFNPDHLKRAKSLEIRGTAILRYPRDVRRFDIDLREAKLPLTRDCGGFSLVVSDLSKAKPGDWNPGKWELHWRAVAGKEEPEGVLSLEDSRRRWLKDVYRLQRPRFFAFPYVQEDRPEWLVLTRLIGEETVKYPFVIKGVPVPPKPKLR